MRPQPYEADAEAVTNEAEARTHEAEASWILAYDI